MKKFFSKKKPNGSTSPPLFVPSPTQFVSAEKRLTIRSRGRKIGPGELRELRDLLRQRYALDLELWGCRNASINHQKRIQVKMERADAILDQIRLMISKMDHRSLFNTDVEYAQFKEVKARVLAAGKRTWTLQPPWQDADL